MSLYGLALAAHSINRWVVLGVATVVLLRSAARWRRQRPWLAADERLHAVMVGVVDLQLTIGVLLIVFLSPLPEAFLYDWRAGMKIPALRFFVMDHAVAMLAAVGIVHAARTRSRLSTDGAARHRTVCLSTAVALTLMLASIPWPGLQYGRPGLRSPWDSMAGVR